MIASGTGARHIQVEAGVSCSARKQRSTWNQPANEKTYMRVCQCGRGTKWKHPQRPKVKQFK